ncbi:hypothetical protein SLT36_25600 [Aminobacter sp. BA135]
MCAVLTGLDMTPKRRSSAELFRGHSATLDAAEMAVMGNTIGMIVATEDIRYLARSSERFAGTRAGGTNSSVRRSSGLCVLAIVPVATWV